jgi:hypothetical protein
MKEIFNWVVDFLFGKKEEPVKNVWYEVKYDYCVILKGSNWKKRVVLRDSTLLSERDINVDAKLGDIMLPYAKEHVDAKRIYECVHTGWTIHSHAVIAYKIHKLPVITLVKELNRS